jgi:hypothetical protein
LNEAARTKRVTTFEISGFFDKLSRAVFTNTNWTIKSLKVDVNGSCRG